MLLSVGHKWTITVFGALSKGQLHDNEVQRRVVGGTSQRMLALTLKRFETDGLVTRTLFPLHRWAAKNKEPIVAERAPFENREGI